MSQLFGDQNTGCFSISPSSEYSGLISPETDWFDLLAAWASQGSSPAPQFEGTAVLWRSAFFMVQLSQPYMATGKTISLTMRTFVRKTITLTLQSFVRVMSLLFNTLPRFLIAFWLRSNHLLISWLQLPFAVIVEPKKRNSVPSSTFSPSICHEVMGLDAMILVFLNI